MHSCIHRLCGSVVNNLFLPVEAYIFNPNAYLLLAFLTPEIEIASSSHFLVFPENARLSTYCLTLRT